MKKNSCQARLEDTFQRSAKNYKSFDLNKKPCQVLLAANIPWYKLQVPMILRFIEEHYAISIPDESTLRKTYLAIRC